MLLQLAQGTSSLIPSDSLLRNSLEVFAVPTLLGVNELLALLNLTAESSLLTPGIVGVAYHCH